MKLYELSNELRNLMDQLSGFMETQLAPEEIKVRLDLFEGQFEFKAEQIGKMILELRSGYTAIDNEIGRLQKRVGQMLGSEKFLLDYLKINMESANIHQVKGELVTVSLRKNPTSLLILDEKEIPEHWWKQPPMPEKMIDKRGIIENFKENGEIVPGTCPTNTTRVEIK
jgi:hypothetical protein